MDTERQLPIDFRTEGDTVIVTIRKTEAKTIDPTRLQQLLAMLICTIRDEKVESYADNISKPSNSKELYIPNRPRVGMFMESISYYSGGRYWAFIFAKLLTYVADVTVITNLMPDAYLSDMARIPTKGKFEAIVDRGWGMYIKENKFDIILGVPINAVEFARAYADRFKLPFYMMLFETPNWIREGKGKFAGDGVEEFWRGYKNALKYADKVICLSKEGMSWAIDWAKGEPTPDKFTYVYPCINSVVADTISAGEERENSIVFIGRAGEHKEPCKELALILGHPKRPENLRVYVLGKMGNVVRGQMAEAFRAKGVSLVTKDGVSDAEKFEILAKSKVLVFPSYFEGFGIPPAEAMYMGIPTVCYDLRVLREFYGDNLYYVPRGEKEKFADRVISLLNGGGNINIEHAKIEYSDYLSTQGTIRRVVDSIFPIKLSVGMIVFNADDYLEACLRGIYDRAHEIIIVEGAVKEFMFAANPDGSSTDRTVEIIKNFSDPAGKIKFIQGKWTDKMHMQNVIAEHITGDVYLKLDSDEFYHDNELEGILDMFRTDKDLWIVRYKFNHFWHSVRHIAVGSQWENPMNRICRWRKDFRHPLEPRGFNYFTDSKGAKVDAPHYKVIELDERLVYHFAYVKPEKKVQEKLKYYQSRQLGEMVLDTWTGWTEGKPTQPTHGGGSVENFTGVLPEAVASHPLIKVSYEEVMAGE